MPKTTIQQVRQKYLDFFQKSPRNHALIPPAPLVPQNDPTTLFTSSGMQPLVPYLKGQPHPMGTRLVNSQPSFRAEDIDEIGDNRHTTFFEMLGNWSLGDYFKSQQLPWFYQFLTQALNLDPKHLYVTVFEGSHEVEKDEASIRIWQQIFTTQAPAKPGLDGFDPDTKIYTYPATKNWWSRAGVPENMPPGEIGGPDSEVFFDLDPDGSKDLHQQSPFNHQPCHPNCDCGRFMEIGNSVFMQYEKQADGSFKPLPKQNVDFGGGLERLTAAANNTADMFTINCFSALIDKLTPLTNLPYGQDPQKDISYRIVADHLRGSVMLLSQGVVPSNKLQGYILRRLIRRAVFHLTRLNPQIATEFVKPVITSMAQEYPEYITATPEIESTLTQEAQKFFQTLKRGTAKLEKSLQKGDPIDGTYAFNLYQSEGIPLELTLEMLQAYHLKFSPTQTEAFKQQFAAHQDKSRTAAKGMFTGGLAGHSEKITQFHTATHLLHQALRDVLGDTVQQMGSNITVERLRFDFKHGQKLTPSELQQVETIINTKISQDLPVHKTIQPKDQALKSGALAFFREKYPDTVSVYTIGNDPQKDWYSKELCGGPHVSSTAHIGAVRIKKEESVGAGTRRIYIVHASG